MIKFILNQNNDGKVTALLYVISSYSRIYDDHVVVHATVTYMMCFLFSYLRLPNPSRDYVQVITGNSSIDKAMCVNCHQIVLRNIQTSLCM